MPWRMIDLEDYDLEPISFLFVLSDLACNFFSLSRVFLLLCGDPFFGAFLFFAISLCAHIHLSFSLSLSRAVSVALVLIFFLILAIANEPFSLFSQATIFYQICACY